MTDVQIAQDFEYLGDDRWKWAVWLEGPQHTLDQIDTVAWELHPTFPQPLRWVDDRASGFRLEAVGWGTFEIRATYYNEEGQPAGPVRHRLQLVYPDAANAQEQAAAPAKGDGEPLPKVFLAASLREADLVRRLSAELEARGCETIDPNADIAVGTVWQSSIEAEIEHVDALVVVVRDDLSAFSEYAWIAAERGTRVIPLRVGDSEIPPELASRSAVWVDDPSDLGPAAAAIAEALGA